MAGGRVGRPRTPTAILEARGTIKHDPKRYADRALEPKPELGVSVKPSFLSPLASKHWNEFEAMLTKTRILTENDVISLAQLCEAFAEWRAATDKVVKEKSRLTSDYRRMDLAFNRLLKIQQEFGMTPASRTRVQAVPKEKDANRFGQRAGAARGIKEEEDDDS